MATINEQLRDKGVDHAVNLQHYNEDILRKVRALLGRTDAKLFTELQSVLARLEPSAFTVQRLDAMLSSVRSLIDQGYQDMRTIIEREMRDLVGYELEWQHRTLVDTLPARIVADVGITQVSVEQVLVAVRAQPLRGKLLSEWATQLSAQKYSRVSDILRMGYVSGETVQQMTRQVRETTGIDRRNAEAVVRTAMGHTANFAKQQYYKANKDIVGEVQWVSTLDNRTTELCIIRDGKRYTSDEAHRPIGHRVPWLGGPGRLHWNCRSTSIPVVKGWKELGVELPAIDRAAMGGTVSGDTTYAEWLMKQPAARQDEILGPTRGRLIRQGGLAVPSFFDSRGKFLTLEQLRIKEFKAFKQAGI